MQSKQGKESKLVLVINFLFSLKSHFHSGCINIDMYFFFCKKDALESRTDEFDTSFLDIVGKYDHNSHLCNVFVLSNTLLGHSISHLLYPPV